jgi:hypothetical protein
MKKIREIVDNTGSLTSGMKAIEDGLRLALSL